MAGWITLFSGGIRCPQHAQADLMFWSSCDFLFFLVGHAWGEVPSQVAFPWPCAVMLRWASIFSNDSQAYFYSWAWCYRSPRDWWMAGNSFHILSRYILGFSLNSHSVLICLFSFLTCSCVYSVFQDKLLSIAFEQTLVQVKFLYSGAQICNSLICNDYALQCLVHIAWFWMHIWDSLHFAMEASVIKPKSHWPKVSICTCSGFNIW